MIGRQLAHYRLDAKLGEGGMGVVYRARDTRLERDVALKILPPGMANDAVRLERFTREAKIAAGLSHPNIVTLHSVEHAEGVRFLTMELVHGESLDRVIPRGGLPLTRLFDLAIPLADAVAAAHEAGITHRDLKPANVMVTREDRVKILDFGLARFDGPSAIAPDAATEALTEDGVIVGTVRYMSPEQARAEAVDHRSDIFSLGALLYEMATGNHPFTGASSAELLSAILRDDPPPVTKIKGELPRHLGRVVQRCLEKDPRKRYQSALDVRNELEGLREEIASGASRTAQPPAPRARRRPAALAITLILALAAIVFLLARALGPGGRVPGKAPVTGESGRKTVVVLPFENLGEPDDAFFAAGMTDELTSRLGRVDDLAVIARSSARRYAGGSTPLAQLGVELGVDYVVEGTVRWARGADGASRVRITPTLVQVTDGTQLWSTTFDRDLADVFEIQADIASRVIAELGLTLLAPEREAVSDRPTDNLEAYQAYLRAQENWLIAGFDRRRFRLAVELYERAADLDPEFLQPLVQLVSVYGTLYFTSGDPLELEGMAHSLERAVALDPDAPGVALARGVWAYYAEKDYPTAADYFESAAAALPNDIEPRQMVAFVRRRQGRLEETIEWLRGVLELSPRDPHTHYELARTLEAVRRYEEADRYLVRAHALEPDRVAMFDAHAWLLLRWKGDVERALAVARQAPSVDDPLRDTPVESLDWILRDWEAIRQRIEARLDAHTDDHRRLEDLHDIAFAYRELGESEKAAARGREALALARRLAEQAPDSFPAQFDLIAVEAVWGDAERALAAADTAARVIGPDRFLLPVADELRAWTLAVTGRPDAAVDLLEKLVDAAYDRPISVPLLRLDPWWDALRGHPGFERLISAG